MLRHITTSTMLLLSTLAIGQTVLRITNVTVTEKEEQRRGQEATAVMNDAEGTDHVVIFAEQGIVIKARVKVSTHHVVRSSVKDGAVNAVFDIEMTGDGEKDKRRVEKIFYAEQARTTHVKEKFTFKVGITVRVITVEFDAAIE